MALLFAIGYVRGFPGLRIKQGTKQTAWVQLVTMAGAGESVWIWQEKVRMWSCFDPLKPFIETGARHKYLLSIG